MRAVHPSWKLMVLVCNNQRASAMTSCGSVGGSDLRREIRERVTAAGLRDRILVSTVRCLGVCAPGLRTIALWSVDGQREIWVVPHENSSMDEVWSRILQRLATAP